MYREGTENFVVFQSATSSETPEQSDVDQSEKGKPTDNQSDSGGDDTTSYTKTDDSLSDTSAESKSGENDKSSVGGDSDIDHDKHGKKYESGDSVTPPPPVLTPVKKRGRPPGRQPGRPPGPGRGRGSVLRKIQGAVRKPRGGGRGRGNSPRGLLRGIRKGLTRGHSKTRGVGLIRGMGKGFPKSPVRGLGRGRGGVRGRGIIRPAGMLKLKMKSDRPVGRPKKIPHDSAVKVSEKTNTQKSDTKSPQKRSIFDFKIERSKSEIEKKRDSASSLLGVSILEHEPDLMDDDDFDDDNFMEHHVDPRNYWCPPANVKTLLDQVCITDVTTSSGTITFRECTSETGFFKKKEQECS